MIELFIVFEQEKVVMLLKTQAATEVTSFLAHHPAPEQIVAFHPFSKAAERAYKLIHSEREGSLTQEERKEIESYLMIEYLIIRFVILLFLFLCSIVEKVEK